MALEVVIHDPQIGVSSAPETIGQHQRHFIVLDPRVDDPFAFEAVTRNDLFLVYGSFALTKGIENSYSFWHAKISTIKDITIIESRCHLGTRRRSNTYEADTTLGSRYRRMDAYKFFGHQPEEFRHLNGRLMMTVDHHPYPYDHSLCFPECSICQAVHSTCQ
jgi:hypothetical protein